MAFAPTYRRRLEARLDFLLHPLGVAPHVDDQGRDQHRRRQREDALPQRLIVRALEQHQPRR